MDEQRQAESSLEQTTEPPAEAVVQARAGRNRRVSINLDDIEEETRCAVCLGVIKDARLIAQCMHRFCALCIEKWLRQSKQNDCPQCRKPMQSRRDCKADKRFDRLVAILFNNVEEYEKQQVDQEVLDKAFQHGRELYREQERRKAAMPKLKRGPVPRSCRAAMPECDLESPAGAAAAAGGATLGYDDDGWRPSSAQGHHGGTAPAKKQRLEGPRDASGNTLHATYHASHKKGSRKSRHGHKEPLYVPLDDDNDVADLAARLTHQAQVGQWGGTREAGKEAGVASAPQVALLLKPNVQEEGLQPLQFPHLTAAGTATVADLQSVGYIAGASAPDFKIKQVLMAARAPTQMLTLLQPSSGTFAIGALSSLTGAHQFSSAALQDGSEVDSGRRGVSGQGSRIAIQSDTTLLALSKARASPLAPLVLNFWRKA